MFVCMCNGHREQELRELADQGVRDVDIAYAMLGGEPVCRRCIDFAHNILNPDEPAEEKISFDGPVRQAVTP